jgi:uncharacterized membrane protein
MSPEIAVAVAWLLFLGTHVGIAHARRPIVARIGEIPFLVAFSVLAQVLFFVVVMTYAAHRFEGARGLALAEMPVARAILLGFALFGIVLMAAAFAPAQYFRSPQSLLRAEAREPYGLERITRHPIWAGVVITFGAHALLATRLVGAIFFSGFVVVSVFGSMHQGRKLVAQKGPDYQRFLEQTSAVPFAAILRGRQRVAWGEQPWLFLAFGCAAALGLRAIHPSILADGGVWFAAAVVLSTAFFIGEAIVRGRRARKAKGS